MSLIICILSIITLIIITLGMGYIILICMVDINEYNKNAKLVGLLNTIEKLVHVK